MCGILHWLYGILHGMQTVVLCIQAYKDWMHAVFVAEYTANLCYRTCAHVHHVCKGVGMIITICYDIKLH